MRVAFNIERRSVCHYLTRILNVASFRALSVPSSRPPRYYHQNGTNQFPEGSVAGWNTNDHGVNNAEGAMKWPAVQWRMTGSDDDRAQQDFMLGKSVSL